MTAIIALKYVFISIKTSFHVLSFYTSNHSDHGIPVPFPHPAPLHDHCIVISFIQVIVKGKVGIRLIPARYPSKSGDIEKQGIAMLFDGIMILRKSLQTGHFHRAWGWKKVLVFWKILKGSGIIFIIKDGTVTDVIPVLCRYHYIP